MDIAEFLDVFFIQAERKFGFVQHKIVVSEPV
jgi:hypothetical protein